MVEEVAMKVNMLEAKSQLSKLVKAALAGEEVIIASNGTPLVCLVPVAKKGGLAGWGKLKRFAAAVDAAFTAEVDAEVARSLEGRR
jgi:prevent-host-death family protein